LNFGFNIQKKNLQCSQKTLQENHESSILSKKTSGFFQSFGISKWNFPWKIPHFVHWLVVSTPPKNMKVSWDDDYSQLIWKVIKFYGSSHHQPLMIDGYQWLLGVIIN